MSHLQNSDVAEVSGYGILNSLRFQSASSQYAARTPASAGNRQKWTWSGWVKRGALGTVQALFGAPVSSGVETLLSFQANDTLQFYQGTSGIVALLNTTQVFRDPSAWYHIIAIWDTSNATASDRLRLFVNGNRVIAFSSTTNPVLNLSSHLNNNIAHQIGLDVVPSSGSFYPFDGYMTEVNFIDGVSLTPSSFGEFDSLTGQWVAKKYTGTYGTNGFYLPFSNGTSTTTLGADSSGNSNNWTLTNFTRSAGVSDCWMYDVPSGNGGASGTQPSSNYAVLNPLSKIETLPTISNSNLKESTGASWAYARTSMACMLGSSFYAEAIVGSTTNSSSGLQYGVAPTTTPMTSSGWHANHDAVGQLYALGSIVASGLGTLTAGDVVQIASDGNGKVWLGKNNVWWNSTGGTTGNPSAGINPTFTITAQELFFVFGSYSNSLNVNFGQRSFQYSPPSGFKALCTANLPTATIKKGNTVFDATLYTGTGANQTIINAAGFSPDIVWGKSRSTADFHVIANTVVGANKYLFTNSTSAEGSLTDVITSFNSNGFTLGANQTINVNGAASVAWQWDAGSSTVTNTSGTISSQVRANPTAGVSVVTYTGTGANATVGHGLGVAPAFFVIKQRSGVENWIVYHKNQNASPASGHLMLQSTSAFFTSSTVFNNTVPTSSVFSVGTALGTNQSSATFVAYAFAEISGFSKAFSYTGNGSADGVFVYLGFRPKYIMIKNSSAVTDWIVYDTSRSPYNVVDTALNPNTSAADGVTSAYNIDLVSNGFKCRSANASLNSNGATFVGIAFAENPFQNSNAR